MVNKLKSEFSTFPWIEIGQQINLHDREKDETIAKYCTTMKKFQENLEKLLLNENIDNSKETSKKI